ncbi:hypothetical protein [Rhodococcus tukisamuensis]|uniref:Carboxypeptidase regulatory-like domain-containing protein n=1 Tax=Rhodococcus tukisamuensis TaxID=168276 RepID=A0A1G6T7M0_9NOCA|nr:hypothetical protein [Rhodococcus tukisamuensis]SDD24983.1 hypothetical protein SAMN05444580_103425 [Rhodococcus tukisamuensis]
MTTLTRAALAGTAMTAALVMGAGTASAATIGTAGSAMVSTPTGADQLCGTAYIGADTHVGAPPAGARAVQGVTVTGKLYDSGSVLQATASATTDANGRYCIQAPAGLASVITSNGWVDMSFTPATVTDTSVTPNVTYAGRMSGPGTPSADGKLTLGEFIKHPWPNLITATSAWKVNVVFA